MILRMIQTPKVTFEAALMRAFVENAGALRILLRKTMEKIQAVVKPYLGRKKDMAELIRTIKSSEDLQERAKGLLWFVKDIVLRGTQALS